MDLRYVEIDGRKLRRRREALGLNQRRFAEAADLNQSTLCHLETGKRSRVMHSTWARIQQVLAGAAR